MTTKAYLIGGFNNGTFYNDFWETTDGENWTKKGNLPFVNTSSYPSAICYHNGEIFVVPSKQTDVWVYNGTSWSKRASGQFTSRYYISLISYKGKLFLFCDFGSPSIYYSTDNGYNWTADSSITINSGASPGLSAVIVNDVLTVVNYGSTFYQTSDGVTWTTKTASNVIGTSNAIALDTSYFLAGSAGSTSTTNSTIRKYNINSLSSLSIFTTFDYGTKLTNFQLLKFGNYVYALGGNRYTGGVTNSIKKFNTSGTLISTLTGAFEAREGMAIVQFEEASDPSDLTGGGNIQSQSSVNLAARLLDIYLNTSALVTDVSIMKGQANTFTVVTDLQAGLKVSALSTNKNQATLFNTKIDGKVSPINATSQTKAKAEVIDPSTLRVTISNIVKNNNIPVQNAKVMAVRESDNLVFMAISDSSGAWSLNLEVGTYHITCVYKDGSQNVFGLVKPFVVIQ